MRVLVLDGNENQAVAAVRSLGRAGHTVLAGAPAGWSKAGWSRYARGQFRYVAPQDDAAAFVASIVQEAGTVPGTLVMPMTERTTIPLSAQRSRLDEAGARYILPAHEDLLRATDKQVTTALARSLGVATPATIVLDASDDADHLATTVTYPVVLKPRASEETSASGATVATGKPLYARDDAQFRAAVLSLRARAGAILVQEFVEGSGAGYFALMRNGELRAEFAHRRIRDVRPTGSGSAVRESAVIDPRVREASIAILRALNWHGVAMVEFRIRPDGTPVFMEVNGRFWNSLALPIHAGVDFPALLASLAEQGDVAPVTSYPIGVRCRWWLGDVRHLLAVMRGRPPGFEGHFPGRLRSMVDFLTPVPGTFHDNFSWDDPLPELGDWLDFTLRRVPAALGSPRARGAA